jgi:photosystem II stability/assembly factor-like uncharacterized protein
MRLTAPRCSRHLPTVLFALFIVLVPTILVCQTQPNSSVFPGLQWRLIGPFRGGRVTAVAGIAGDPRTYYFGTPGGGVWKTTDGGHVWKPIFDQIRVPSIGAMAVAPSAPDVVYVGTGEQTRGKGMYRSSDAGMTWNSAGLEDLPYIQAVIVDPHNPNVVVVGANSVGFAILWRPLPKSATTDHRGIFKTEDGGKTWKKVYASDSDLGVVDMCADPDDPGTVYASVYKPESGTGASQVPATSNIIRSTDGGSTWAPLESKGLPEKGRGRLGLSVASKTNGKRLYAIVEQGFFRSDDGGANWSQSSKDPRVIGSPYFSRIFTDTQNPDVLYAAQTSLYRSTDGGKTFEAYVGAPSGDDFHVLWIDPQSSAHMILGVDQGAIVTVDAGKTWSSWYNQPTGQFYHVSTNNLFPYRVYGAQQDSGTAGVLSRSDYGEILIQDWYSVGGFEYAFIAPDPAHPDYVFSTGWYGSVVRLDTSTGQIATMFERGQRYRAAGMPPLVFSPQDPSTLYLGMQFVLKTTDGGRSWKEISPDLTGYVEKAEEPEEKGTTEKPPPPSLTALALSPVQAGVMWAGTTNRLVHLTRNEGTSWQNVTPPGLADPVEILYVEPSHHDAATAYLTIGGTRESTPPNILRTHDYGQTWQKIVNGFPPGEMVRVVREDTKRKGLLYAGTDTGIFVSWDDGDHWQPFSLNLPPTPITDLTVHDNDLALSTFGRSLWILDDLTPVRAMNSQVAAANSYLFAPATALRARWDDYQDTPFPPETPAGKNPPDGAIIDYYLKNAATSELTLTVIDDKGNEIAQYSSNPKPVHLPPANVPDYWFAPPTALTKTAGVNRFAWDLRYPAPATLPYGYYGNLLEYTEYTLADHAVPGDTPVEQPRGPLVVPGKYTIELRYAGQTLRQSLTIEPDPRVHVSQSDLANQLDLALSITRGMKSSHDEFLQVAALRKALMDAQKAANGPDVDKIKQEATALTKKLDSVDKGTKTAPGLGPLNRDLARLIFSVESADIRPTDTVRAAVQQNCASLDTDLQQWQQINQQDLVAFNAMLLEAKTAALPIATVDTRGCKQ